METIPYLTKEDVAVLDSLLLDYLQKAEAKTTLLLDKGGTIIAQQGETGSIDVSIIAALAAGSFAATKELASRLGEKEFSAIYHQGKHLHIFVSAIDEHSILTTIFGENTTVGLVRFYTVNLGAQLASLLDSLRKRSLTDTHFLPALELESKVPAGKIFV